MKARFALYFVVFFVAVLSAWSQNADERYIQIYHTIQEGDHLAATGQPGQAAAKYQEAQAALKILQAANPTWQEKVVKFRLNYLANKLADLAPKPVETTPPAAPAPAPAPASAPAAPPAAVPKPAEAEPTGAALAMQAQLKALQDEIGRLFAENNRLQGKLKEALAVQPAPIDPRELAKAEERIRDVQKQRDLLQVALEAAQAKAAKPESALAETERKALEEVKQRLAAQTEVVTALQRENEDLKKQNAALQGAGQKAAMEAALRESDRQLMEETRQAAAKQATLTASLQRENEELKRQNAALVLAAQTTPEAAARAKERQQFEEMKQLLSKQTEFSAALQQENETLRKQNAALQLAGQKNTQAESALRESERNLLEDAKQRLAKQTELTAAAQAQYDELKKENAALRLAAQKYSADAAAWESERKILEDTKQRLAKQTELAAAARQQNEALKKQSAEAAAALESERQLVAEATQRLARQTELTTAAQKESETLKRQNAALLAAAQADNSAVKLKELAEQIEVARLTIAALQETNTALRTEMLVVQGRPPGAARPGRTAESFEAEIEVLRARLAAYESEPVPFTAEELALFKKSDAQMAVATTNLTALTNIVKKVRQPPPGAGALFAEAQRAADASRFEEAEQKFTQVLRQDENNLYTLSHLAAVQIDLKRYAEAEKHLQRALAVEPQDPAGLYLLGRLRYAQERYDEALDALSRSASLVPNDFQAQYFLGQTLIQKGNRAQAEKALRKAVQLNPRWGQSHYSLAIVYATQQPPFKELAQWHYQKALSLGVARNPDFEKLLETKTAAKPN